VAGTGYLNKIRPDINAGVYLYAANYFIGLAAQQIIPQNIGFNGGKLGGDSITVLQGKLVPHLFLQAGYRFLLSEDLNFLPSATLKYISPVPVSIDINANCSIAIFLWVGFSVRPSDGYSGLLGINISSMINIGYSYDYNTSRLNTVSNGTHEILIGFLLGNRYGDWCPRNVW